MCTVADQSSVQRSRSSNYTVVGIPRAELEDQCEYWGTLADGAGGCLLNGTQPYSCVTIIL